jgi:hypothetical protein
MVKFVGDFEAADRDGIRYTLCVWVDGNQLVHVETLGSDPVSRIEKGRYQFVRNDIAIELRSDDPKAP